MLRLTCAEARGLIFDFLDGELDPATARAVGEHKSSCKNCPPLVTAILGMLAGLRSLPGAIPREDWLARLVALELDPHSEP
jgi:anti-sigma factor RsiW